MHGLRTPGEEIVFTAQPKIKSQSQIFRCLPSMFCLPHWPKILDLFDLCLHWVSVVRALEQNVHNSKIHGKNLRKFVRIGIKVALNNLLLSKDTKDILTRKTMASLGFFKQAQFLSANKGQFSCEFLLRMQNKEFMLSL